MMTATIGLRLKALRQKGGLSQEEVARRLDLPHRQTLGAIETGERSLSADELIRATTTFGVSLDYFTDPFSVAGEAMFSWRRRSNLSEEVVAEFEGKVGRMFGAYRTLCAYLGQPPSRVTPSMHLTRASSVEEAIAVGEEWAGMIARGKAGEEWLASAVEATFGVPVLNLDAPRGLSGAVCHLFDMDGIFINRADVPGRRNFDLAHELFHVATWSAMPPSHLEQAADGAAAGRPNHVESLADAFASGFLMPRNVLARLPGYDSLVPDDLRFAGWLNSAADGLGVTSMALLARLVQMGRVDEARKKLLLKSGSLTFNGRQDAPPPATLLGNHFVSVLCKAIAEGRISRRAAARLISVEVDSLEDALSAY